MATPDLEGGGRGWEGFLYSWIFLLMFCFRSLSYVRSFLWIRVGKVDWSILSIKIERFARTPSIWSPQSPFWQFFGIPISLRPIPLSCRERHWARNQSIKQDKRKISAAPGIAMHQRKNGSSHPARVQLSLPRLRALAGFLITKLGVAPRKTWSWSPILPSSACSGWV